MTDAEAADSPYTFGFCKARKLNMFEKAWCDCMQVGKVVGMVSANHHPNQAPGNARDFDVCSPAWTTS
jgi:hypothetical protein